MCSNYNLQSGNVSIAVGGKYTLDDGSVLKVSRVGISWGFKLPIHKNKKNRPLNCHDLTVRLKFLGLFSSSHGQVLISQGFCL